MRCTKQVEKRRFLAFRYFHDGVLLVRATIVLLIALLAVLAGWPAAAQTTPPVAPVPSTSTPSIAWRLKNPFRLFRDPQHWTFYAEAARKAAVADAAAATGFPVLAAETRLAEITDGTSWSARIFEHLADEACWYAPPTASDAPAKAAGKPEPCGDYIKPKTHAVLLSAPGVAQACTWRVGATEVAMADCRQETEVGVPYPEGASVSLSLDGSVAATEAIKVEDLLIIGLGDSFGAGDGNPDRPVSFRANSPMSYDNERDGYPQRYPLAGDIPYTDVRFRNRAAGWAHRNCHRSLYSHQIRAALHLALSDARQQRSVTYLGLACTGSTMLTMFDPYNGLDEPPSAADTASVKRRNQLSQLDILASALCEPGTATIDTSVNYNDNQVLELGQRQIHVRTCTEAKRLRRPDAVLLSIGGNDVGFSGLVSNASLRGQFLGVVKLFSEDPRITPAKARSYMGRVPGRYAALAKALKAVTGLTEAQRVFLSAYPQMHENEDGKGCASGRRGFDVSAAWLLQGKAVAAAEKFMDEDLIPGMEKAASAAGWTFVDGHRRDGRFKNRGICAVSADELETPALANIAFPRFRERGLDISWQPFKPDDYKPYAARQRYFLTPNDAFLAVHFHTRQFVPLLDGGPDIQLALWSAYSGAFHPTAEGQAVIADAVLQKVLSSLRPASSHSP